MRTLLALDPATVTGVSIFDLDSGELIEVLEWDFGLEAKEQMGGRRWEIFWLQLAFIQHKFGLSYICYERTVPIHGMDTRVMVGLSAIIEFWCVKHAIPWMPVSPSEIKKRATGKGNAKKDLVHRAAIEKWGNVIATNNMADAAWCGLYVWEQLREQAK